MRYLNAIMAMLVLAAPGAFAHTETEGQCFAPAVDACAAAAPASDDVFLLAQEDPECLPSLANCTNGCVAKYNSCTKNPKDCERDRHNCFRDCRANLCWGETFDR